MFMLRILYAIHNVLFVRIVSKLLLLRDCTKNMCCLLFGRLIGRVNHVEIADDRGLAIVCQVNRPCNGQLGSHKAQLAREDAHRVKLKLPHVRRLSLFVSRAIRATNRQFHSDSIIIIIVVVLLLEQLQRRPRGTRVNSLGSIRDAHGHFGILMQKDFGAVAIRIFQFFELKVSVAQLS